MKDAEIIDRKVHSYVRTYIVEFVCLFVTNFLSLLDKTLFAHLDYRRLLQMIEQYTSTWEQHKLLLHLFYICYSFVCITHWIDTCTGVQYRPYHTATPTCCCTRGMHLEHAVAELMAYTHTCLGSAFCNTNHLWMRASVPYRSMHDALSPAINILVVSYHWVIPPHSAVLASSLLTFNTAQNGSTQSGVIEARGYGFKCQWWCRALHIAQ